VVGPGCILPGPERHFREHGPGGRGGHRRAVGCVGHIHIGDGAKVGAKSAVTKDVPAGGFRNGHPARDHRLWLKRGPGGRLARCGAPQGPRAHSNGELGEEENP